MKTEKTPSSKKPKRVPADEVLFRAGGAAASPAADRAGQSGHRGTRLSWAERNFAIEPATDYRGERSGSSDGLTDPDWLEAEIALELEQLRRRSLPQSD